MKIQIKKYSNRFHVYSGYDEVLHGIIKGYKGRYWDNESKVWKINNDNFEDFISQLKKNEMEYELDEFKPLAKITEQNEHIELTLNFFFKEFRMINNINGAKYEDRKWTIPLDKMNELIEILNKNSIEYEIIKNIKKKTFTKKN